MVSSEESEKLLSAQKQKEHLYSIETVSPTHPSIGRVHAAADASKSLKEISSLHKSRFWCW
jgi:hypothetical protein